jgi:hypothetical protein
MKLMRLIVSKPCQHSSWYTDDAVLAVLSMDADDVVAAQQSLKCQPLLAEEESKPPASVCRGGITSLFCFIARATCSER